ncbi:hypothetical protein DVH24_000300 [Malus domestica]|uniref:Uncharacterized protein n=1 Tax=Malus domestica TaxID=3750 RepID=A0A498J5F7_MALDO|nr:hypothetical protein DVH24_000300 [Malus domestica]
MLERRLGTLKIGTYGGGGVGGGWMEEAVRRVKEEGQMKWKVSSSVVLGLAVGMKMMARQSWRSGMVAGEEYFVVMEACFEQRLKLAKEEL